MKTRLAIGYQTNYLYEKYDKTFYIKIQSYKTVQTAMQNKIIIDKLKLSIKLI